MHMKKKIIRVDRFSHYTDIEERYSSKTRKIEITVPLNMRMLCAIFNINIEQVLSDYMTLLSCSYCKDGKNKQYLFAKKFFISRHYNKGLYTKLQVNNMFAQLKYMKINLDIYNLINNKDTELFWQNQHMCSQHWFRYWYQLNKRDTDVSSLDNF